MAAVAGIYATIYCYLQELPMAIKQVKAVAKPTSPSTATDAHRESHG